MHHTQKRTSSQHRTLMNYSWTQESSTVWKPSPLWILWAEDSSFPLSPPSCMYSVSVLLSRGLRKPCWLYLIPGLRFSCSVVLNKYLYLFEVLIIFKVEMMLPVVVERKVRNGWRCTTWALTAWLTVFPVVVVVVIVFISLGQDEQDMI